MSRTVEMYSEKLPQTRCALLAKAIWEACVLSGSESITIAEEFYCGMNDVNNSVTLVLRGETVYQNFEHVCREHSIYIKLNGG